MDAACYGALCKIAQTYLMRYPLVEGDGNLGTQEGNGYEASSRYTNAKPSIYADLMMMNFKKNSVPLKETYNGEYMEPVVLPSLLPNAIVNGREAIAIGMSHNSLPHNLTEVCEAIIKRLELNRSLTVDEILMYIKGPDFPLENVIINKRDIKTAFATGKSAISLKVQGKYTINKDEIIFNTIPYRTYRNKIKEQIVKNIDILSEFIEDFNDESNVGINKLVFKIKKGVSAEEALLRIFSYTDLQTTVSYNMNYIVDGTPKMCSMSNLIDAYVQHQNNVLINTTNFDKEKAELKKHVLEGMLIIITNIDKAINLIRNSENRTEAEKKLILEFNLDEVQAKAVLDMKLSKLTKLDKDELITELEKNKIIIAECVEILTNEVYRNKKIIEKIEWLKTKYGDARRTELIDTEIPKIKMEKEIKEVVPKDVVVVTTESGYIKKVPIANYKVQKKGGKGVKNNEEVILSTIKTNTVDILMLFTNKGKMYRVIVDKIPEGTNTSKGTYINQIIKSEPDEKIIAVASLHTMKPIPKYAIFITKKGMIKKTLLEEYTKVNKNTGMAAIKFKEGDSLVKVSFQDDEDIIFISKKGMTLRINPSTIASTGKNTMGVIGMKLSDGDEILTALPVHKHSDTLAIVYTSGLGKKINFSEISVQNRAGKGMMLYKANEEMIVAGAAMISDEDNILIIGNKKSICISATDIPLLSRTALGNVLIKESIVTSIAKL